MAQFESIPSARRLMESLRDLGYDFPQAVADLVDNSLSAGATQVDIEAVFEGDRSFVRICDNGSGMTNDQLREAMRYGSDREYSEKDLGRFGLGLKTASLSQCRRLSVVSRPKGHPAELYGYCWDLAHIQATNKWEVLVLEGAELVAASDALSGKGSGTVILWEQLDRILGYEHPYSEAARKRMSSMCRELEAHLAMVFHRFLANEMTGRLLRISLNGNNIEPWDPFCRSEAATITLPMFYSALEHNGKSGKVVFEPYILPREEMFSSADAHRRAAGPQNWNPQQGLYFYRAGRLIQCGGWSGLRAIDEHSKLARVAVSFTPGIDDAFQVNVAKMRVQLPAALKSDLKAEIGRIATRARKVYDGKERSKKPTSTPKAATDDATGSKATRFPSMPQPDRPALGAAAVKSDERAPVLLTAQEWGRRLLMNASNEELPVVKNVLTRLLLREGQ